MRKFKLKADVKQGKFLLCFVAVFAFIIGMMPWGGPTATAAVRPPVGVTIVSTDELVVGQQMTVQVVLQAGELEGVGFDLIIPQGWVLVSGPTSWTGALHAGQPVEFSATVIPSVQNPEPIKGKLRVPGWNDTEWIMYMAGGGK